MVTTQDEVLRKQKMTYDVLGRLAKTEVLNSDGTVYSTVANTYNARDQVTLIRQYQGDATSTTYQDTTMAYDGHGRLQTRHLPAQFDHSLPVSSTFDYYADDLLQKETDPRGASSTYTYNGRHLITGITYAKPASSNPSSPDQIETIPNVDPVTFGYDEAGNRTSMTDGLGQTAYTYDTWSRLGTEARTFTGVTGNPNSPLQYTYNLAGELTSLTDAFGQKVDYLYDQAGELTTAKIGSVNYVSGIKYRAWGAPKQMDAGNNLRESAAYNSRLQVTQFDVRNGGGTGAIVMGYSYRYDFDGQTANNNDGRVRFAQDLTLTNSPLDRSYSYDHAGRLTSGRSGSEANGQQPPPPSYPTGPYYHTFGFDAFDNLTARGGRNGYLPLGSSPISYSTTYTNNRNSAWTYNLAGDVTDADQQHFLWDAAGQNSQITTIVNGATTMIWSLGYDGDKHNVFRTTDDQHGGVTTTYSIRSSVLGGQVTNEMNASGLQQKTYIYANGRKIARQKSGNTYWLSEDPANLTNIETDSAGAIFDRVQLDALGVITATGSGGGIPPSDSFNPQGYYGNPVSPIDGCRLDGAPFPCDWATRMVNAGDAAWCPNNDCGPRPSLDKNGVPIPGVFEVFNATANGYMPFNGVYVGSGFWQYPRSDVGGFVEQQDELPVRQLRRNPSSRPRNAAQTQAQAQTNARNQLDNCRIYALLNTLAFSEGADYDTVVMGTVIRAPGHPELVGQTNVKVPDFSEHPNILVQVGANLTSTAAGRYQFLYRTWTGLGLPDFSPGNQDVGAVMLMRQRDMITPLFNGDIDHAIMNGNREWASLPGSPYGQGTRSLNTLKKVYNKSFLTCVIGMHEIHQGRYFNNNGA